MDETSIVGGKINRQLVDAVTAKNDLPLTESKLQKLVQECLLNTELSELLSMLCEIISQHDSNYHATYKTTIVMKYLCDHYPEKMSTLLAERSTVLRNLTNYSYVDDYGKDRGINVGKNAKQLLNFVESEKKTEATIICMIQSDLDSTLIRLFKTLISVDVVNSETVLRELRSEIGRVNELLPGPATPDKYVGSDKSPRVDDIEYGKIVERVVDIFDKDWPLKGKKLDEVVERLIVVEGGSFPMLHESLTVLDDALKDSTNARVTEAIALLLEKLIKSEAPFAAITEICKSVRKPTMETADIDSKWQKTLQIIVSLPNRIANKLNGQFADCFSPDDYAKIISLHVGRAISFLHSLRCKLGIVPRVEPLSALIGKAVIVLGVRRFADLFDIMSEWCLENREGMREFIIEVLIHVDGSAVHPIAVTILSHENPTIVDEKIFGNLLTDPNWKYVFTVKIPLLTYHENETILKNLIAYLANFSDDKCILKELLMKLLDIWGDRSAMNHTSLEQHEYITKLILMSVRESRNNLNQRERETAKRLLFHGTSAHLESTQTELRAMGMITGEIVIENLVTSDDEPKLTYDYDGMPKQARELVERLRNFGKIEKRAKKSSNEERRVTVGNLVFGDVGQRKLYELAVNCGVITAALTAASNEASVNLKECPETKVPETGNRPKTIEKIETNSNVDDDLDSDDDLVPYDMSNDTPVAEKLRPAYLRDFRDNLINAQSNTDPNIFEQSMIIGEELILSQLPDDDVSFAVELLQILISLQEISCVDNFGLLKFNCCVAISTVYPKESAKYMCEEFHKKIGHYSIKDRLFILDVLKEAARRLSKIPMKPEVNEKPAKRVERKKPIAKPVSLAIDMKNRKKYETLFDDDFEVVPDTGSSTSDWEEIVSRRIASNTRIFAHASKIPTTTMNRFNDVASFFFYPLLYGFRRKETCMYDTPATFEDQENILLVNYLKTLSTIMVAAENCVIVPKMAKEILNLAWTLRYHTQAEVRLAVIENTASVIVTLPKEGLTTELMELIFEMRSWLADVSIDGLRGDPDSNCRAMGKNVVALIDATFQSALNQLSSSNLEQLL